MKVTFLKDHGAYKIGETYDLPEPSANYLVRCNVAEPAKEKPVKVEPPAVEPPTAPAKEKVENPADQKKNDQEGAESKDGQSGPPAKQDQSGPTPKQEDKIKKPRAVKAPAKEKVEK